MSGHTRKHKVQSFLADIGENKGPFYTLDATLYTSGGVTHSLFWDLTEYDDLDQPVATTSGVQTFRKSSARQDAYDYWASLLEGAQWSYKRQGRVINRLDGMTPSQWDKLSFHVRTGKILKYEMTRGGWLSVTLRSKNFLYCYTYGKRGGRVHVEKMEHDGTRIWENWYI